MMAIFSIFYHCINQMINQSIEKIRGRKESIMELVAALKCAICFMELFGSAIQHGRKPQGYFRDSIRGKKSYRSTFGCQ